MSKIGMREMLEAGAHFGHATRRWNPKMGPYIFGPRNGIHIIDLQKTVPMFKSAYEFMRQTSAKGGKVLFVGTKKQAQEVIKTAAIDANQYYVNYRWLGGMLTNFKTIKQSIERLRKLTDLSTDGTFERLPKKEVFQLARELEKLERNLSGIKDMTKPPKAIVIIDTMKEHIAIDEAHNLDIPIVALVDTNCDPREVDYPIPANDDSIRSVTLFVEKLAQACKEGDMMHQEELAQRRQKSNDKEGGEKPKAHTREKSGPKIDVIAKKTDAAADEEETTSEATTGSVDDSSDAN
jgi:small subunit ribosomal protein S2